MDNLLFKSSRDRNIDGINEALLNGANINCSNEVRLDSFTCSFFIL